jgi:hypothetical protein
MEVLAFNDTLGCLVKWHASSRNITRAFAEELFSDTAGFGKAIDRWPAMMSIGDNPEDSDVPGVDPQNGELRNLPNYERCLTT